MKSTEPKISRAAPPPINHDEQPLLRILVSTAVQRGHTLATLARGLGVTYARLGQWRRGEASIAATNRSVHLRAAKYLDLAPVLVLALAGVITLSDFVLPDLEAHEIRIRNELNAMRQDPYIGAFVPASLATAKQELIMFVIFLYHETGGSSQRGYRSAQWLTALHRAAISQFEVSHGTQTGPISTGGAGIF